MCALPTGLHERDGRLRARALRREPGRRRRELPGAQRAGRANPRNTPLERALDGGNMRQSWVIHKANALIDRNAAVPASETSQIRARANALLICAHHCRIPFPSCAAGAHMLECS